MLNSQLEDLNKKYSSNFKSLQESSEYKIRSVLEEKDSEIQDLKNKINSLERLNEEFSQKNNSNLKLIQDLRNTNNTKFSQNEINLKIKEEEILEIRNYYENVIKNLENNQEEDKKKIVFSYEQNIEKYNFAYYRLSEQLEDISNRMNQVLKDRDLDIRNILDKQKTEMSYYEQVNNELRSEIECHKQNIIASIYSIYN